MQTIVLSPIVSHIFVKVATSQESPLDDPSVGNAFVSACELLISNYLPCHSVRPSVGVSLAKMLMCLFAYPALLSVDG